MASAVAHQLHQCHLKVCLTEVSRPLAVRRMVSFCEAVYDGEREVEGVTARLVLTQERIPLAWQENKIPLLIDPEARVRQILRPDVLIDAIMAKRNVGTLISDAPLVIGLGVGFCAGRDAHVVIETNRGHNLGRIILEGMAEPNTGIPGDIEGFTTERVIRAPGDGIFSTSKNIGDCVRDGETVASVDGAPIEAGVNGVIRGLLRDKTPVRQGMKAGDIDPRGVREYCYTISDKGRTIAGGVLTAILSRFNAD